jgi:tetratricopeptide (TPR) repeat protein
MKFYSPAGTNLLFFTLFVGIFIAVFPSISAQVAKQPSFQQREEAYRSNNIGVAQLERFKYKDAAQAFQRALSIHPSLNIAKINLAIALFNLQDLDAACVQASAVAVLMPDTAQPFYLLGLIAKNQNRTEDAINFFRKVLIIDPSDVGANVNLGQIYIQQRKYEDAVRTLRKALAAEPYNSTALYNLGTALLRSDGRAEGQQVMARFEALRQGGAATSIGTNYLEQGRYAEAIASSGIEQELITYAEARVSFQHVPNVFGRTGRTSSNKIAGFEPHPAKNKIDIFGRFAAGGVLFDIDNDGDLDAAKLDESTGLTIYRNDLGRFVRQHGAELATVTAATATAIVAGDLDNDGFSDLFVVGYGRLSIFHNAGHGRFVDVSVKANLPKYPFLSISCALVDADHDGDLDIFVAGFANIDSPAASRAFAPAPSRLFRNNGDGTFADISAASHLSTDNHNSIAVIPTDFDNKRDIDLLIVNYNSPIALYRNLRDGSFADVAPSVGLDKSAPWTCAAAGDFNKDSFTDFFFGRAGSVGSLAVSDGNGGFSLVDAPGGTENAAASQFVDYDNDGLLDLIVSRLAGTAVFRNVGGVLMLASPGIFAGIPVKTSSPARSMMTGDFDKDGDEDLFLPTGQGLLDVFRNNGGNSNTSKSVILRGRNSNKTGVGAKIDLRSGSLIQKLETYSASPAPAPSDTQFGLGKRKNADAIRIVWPSGVVQAETTFRTTRGSSTKDSVTIEELDRKPSSCPYLYTWNGERFEFITDFLGGGEMGDWISPGEFHFPDSDEYVRIPSGKLKAKNGRYEIRVTNELEEVLFIDKIRLVAIEHAVGSEVYPNEGMGVPSADQKILYTTSHEHPPISATDSAGQSVLKRIEKLDRVFYDSFKRLRIRGYAEEHSLTTRIDDKRGYKGRTLLLLTGWTDYAFSSDNVAASQSGKTLLAPKLQVRNGKGEWQTVVNELGISIGRPQTIVADLTDKFLTDSREVRIVTNFQTYWDKIAVDTSSQHDTPSTEIEPAVADLRERGFSKEVPFGKMISVDYDRVENDSRWKWFSGRFTKLGDVKPLISSVDDVFVISKTGDELVLSFPEMPQPPEGKQYTFLLYADGYSKEMDINSGSPDEVFPLPFKGMKSYPFGKGQDVRMTVKNLEMYDKYTTRTVRGFLPRIEDAIIDHR